MYTLEVGFGLKPVIRQVQGGMGGEGGGNCGANVVFTHRALTQLEQREPPYARVTLFLVLDTRIICVCAGEVCAGEVCVRFGGRGTSDVAISQVPAQASNDYGRQCTWHWKMLPNSRHAAHVPGKGQEATPRYRQTKTHG